MSFDPENFMNAAVDPLQTQFEVAPEGEFLMLIDGDPAQLVPREVSGTSSKTGQPFHFWQLELNCIIQDDNVRAKLGRDKVTVRARVNLDLDDSGRIVTGPNKNIQLGRLRDALGQNGPGWTPKMLLGAGPFIGKVKHNVTEKGTFADVTQFSRVS